MKTHSYSKKKKRTQSKIVTQASSRKARRKEERTSKKRRRDLSNPSTNLSSSSSQLSSSKTESKKEKKAKRDDDYDDDGYQQNGNNNVILPEDDESLDSDEEINGIQEKKKIQKPKKKLIDDDDDNNDEYYDPYQHLDEGTASYLRSEDAEIEELERKLGLSNSKNKSKLNKEYSKLEGFGDDFVDFLDDLDGVVGNLLNEVDSDDENHKKMVGENDFNDDDEMEKFSSSDDEPEELIPMKEGSPIRDASDIDDSDEESEEMNQEEDLDIGSDSEEKKIHSEEEDNIDTESQDEESDNYDDQIEGKDQDTYKPIEGEDIYGNKIQKEGTTTKPAKYIPPHLRKEMEANSTENPSQKTKQEINESDIESPYYQQIRRSIRGLINRLSDSTLEPTLSKISQFYHDPQNSSSTLHEIISSIFLEISVSDRQVMSTLIPLNACLMVAMHHSIGKNIGAFLLEAVVTKYNQVKHDKMTYPSSSADDHEAQLEADYLSDSSKAGSNLTLILCYFYNFHLCHCTLIYDLTRSLLTNFQEIDVEVLLLLFHHAGKELRSDDPSALKDIVLLAKEQAVEVLDNKGSSDNSNDVASASRIQYMLDAMNDLKNNNRRGRSSASVHHKQIAHMEEKNKQYKKFLGHVKSNKQSGVGLGSGGSSGSGLDGTTLRITLKDIMDIPIKGRWWKTGASWVGHQYHENKSDGKESNNDVSKKSKEGNAKDSKLLQLANEARMNTDLRKSIFCIILSSSDCEDAFTNLLKQQILHPHYSEVGRVLVECSIREKNYNPFYTHLGSKICDYQKKCKRALGQVISDFLQRFQDQDERMEQETLNGNEKKVFARQAANLAKLASHWFRDGILKLKVLESVLMESDFFDDDNAESIVVIFLVMMFHTLFESINEKETLKKLFAPRKCVKNSKQTEDELGLMERDEELRKSVSVFLAKYLSKSPKNKEGTMFHKNFKSALKLCKMEAWDFN